ncbi:MAG: DUF4974 domain-containing protein [Flavobacteriaceae bacterium]
MKSDHIDSLIVKYLNHSINSEGMDELISWLEFPENRDIFKEYAKINYSIDYKLGTYNTEEVKNILLHRIQNDKRRKRKNLVFGIFKYAAIIVMAIGTIFFIQKEDSTSILAVPASNEQTVTLELENGRSVILKEEDAQNIVSEKGKVIGKHTKQGIGYEDTELSELVYNTLKVPYGKKFQLTLSDGTMVFLNAGSSIRFPVKFIPGNDRTVFLSGEAFFEVTKNKDPFVVNAENLDVRVLGTKFNVSAYPEDPSMNTVLLEGAVQVLGHSSEENEKVLLEPEQEAIWNKSEKQIEVAKADISSTMAWMNGQLIFREVAFKDIVKKLERSYNCTIINQNPTLDDEIFTATFNVYIETIGQVMTYISKNTPYNFTINKNGIIIIN